MSKFGYMFKKVLIHAYTKGNAQLYTLIHTQFLPKFSHRAHEF